MKPIMALTIFQPYASLVARGAKQHETRSWSTPYRGPLVIHAGAHKSYVRDHMRNFYAEPFRTFLLRAGISVVSALPLGCGLCVVDLMDCIPTEKLARSLSEQERTFGDFSRGRYAWKLENLRLFDQPVRCRCAAGASKDYGRGRWSCSTPDGNGCSSPTANCPAPGESVRLIPMPMAIQLARHPTPA